MLLIKEYKTFNWHTHQVELVALRMEQRDREYHEFIKYDILIKPQAVF